MRNDGRNARVRKRRGGYGKRKQKAGGLLLLLILLVLLILVIYLKNVRTELSKMQSMLRRIEVLQYEKAKAAAGTVWEEGTDEPDYISRIGVVSVEKPVFRTLEETLQRLGELGEENPAIAEICINSNLYPESMLAALANNPEMADFVSGYTKDAENIAGGFTKAEKEQEHPLLLQWDPRWGYQPYGESCIGVAGCGPTSLSMVLYYLTGNDTLTPDRIAGYSMENGYYVEGTGTAWALMEDFPALYGIRVTKPGVTEHSLKAELDAGNLIICAMDKGDFTASGHFIVIYGYDDNGFLVNDPNCIARSRQAWDFGRLKPQIKSVWAYGKFL